MDGNPFYFRARHGEWRLEVVRPGENPVSPWIDKVMPLHSVDGDDPEWGFMPHEEATKIITEYYAKWFTEPKPTPATEG